MRKQEKILFKNLCSFKAEDFDQTLLDAATPTVLGHLFFNRMQAIAYGTLNKHGLLGKVNREFRNSLKEAYNQNIQKNSSFFWCVQYVEEILSECQCKYAMLKGAYLCGCYPDGYRTANDIDLLVHPRDVTKIGNVLTRANFKQGNVRNGIFKEATRKEIIESKMLRGETVPYIKEINLPGMRFLEIDINFALTYKPGDTKIVEQMLENTSVIETDGLRIHTLKSEDFFLHLCYHLYKEATTLPWIEMMRDMTLYKYCDIYVILNNSNKEEVDLLFNYSKKLNMEKICAFAVMYTSQLFVFENLYAVSVAESILKNDFEFIHTIVSPKDNKTFVFTEKDVLTRFFSDKRKELLKEA